MKKHTKSNLVAPKHLSAKRLDDFNSGISEIPDLQLHKFRGSNGEELATDEAAVWKRVLNKRIAEWLQPKLILETHAGLGISSKLYQWASPKTKLITLDDLHNQKKIDIIDIDPFGQPWDTLDLCREYFKSCRCLMITNGEALSVRRNLRRAQRYPTKFYGKRLPLWVEREYIPRLESLTGMHAQFFYAFPTSVRVVLGNKSLPAKLWKGCPQWMWWLERYASKNCQD